MAKPPTTYKELLADCTKFKAKGILPLAYGDRDGYSTDNWVTYDYVSFMDKGDIAKVNDGKMKYTDPKLVKPLQDLVTFKQQGCVNPDASTHENNDANTYFTSGKAAMVQMFPFVVRPFEKALGKNLGLAPLPQSGPHPGPLPATPSTTGSSRRTRRTRPARGTTSRWPWTTRARRSSPRSSAPCRRTSPRRTIKDPLRGSSSSSRRRSQLPLLDSVVPVKVALLYYKQLQAAFSGKVTAQQAMQNVQKGSRR